MALASQIKDIELSEKNKNQPDTSSTISLPLSGTPTPSDLENNQPRPPKSLWSKICSPWSKICRWICRWKFPIFISILVLIIVGVIVGLVVAAVLEEKKKKTPYAQWIAWKWVEAKLNEELADNSTTLATTSPAPAATSCVDGDGICSC